MRSGEVVVGLRYLGPRKVTVLFAALIGVSCVLAAIERGPVFDEFWTVLFLDPSQSLRRSFDLWSADTGHPIGFYAFAKLAYPTIGDNIQLLRLVNFPFALLLIGSCWSRKRASTFPSFVHLFPLVFFGNYLVLERFAELRASFAAMVLLGTLIIRSHHLMQGRARRRWDTCLTLLACAVAFFDYMSFLVAFATLCAAALSTALKAGYRTARPFAFAAMAGWAVVAVSLVNSLRYAAIPAPYNQSMLGFASDLGKVVAITAIANLAVLYSLLRDIWSHGLQGYRSLLDHLSSGTSTAWLGLAIALAVSGMAVLNGLTHVVISRQLLGLVPLGAAFLAASGAASGKLDARWVYSSFVISIAGTLVFLSFSPNETLYAQRLAAAQSLCPTTRVFAIDPKEISQTGFERSDEQRSAVVRRLYQEISSTYGFHEEGPSAQRSFDPKCGGYVWISHVYFVKAPSVFHLLKSLGFSVGIEEAERAVVSYDPRIGALLIALPGAGARGSRS